jgi:hypothetical protein
LPVPAVDWTTTKILTLSRNSRELKHILADFMSAIALQKLEASPFWEIRYLLALHAKTP